MNEIMAFFKVFASFFPHPLKSMGAVCVLCACGLFFPASWQQSLHIWKITNAHPVILWTGFSFCFLILLMSAVEEIGKHTIASAKIKNRLKKLSNQEKHAVSSILKGVSVIAWPHEVSVLYLYREGILWREDTTFTNGQHAYGMSDAARKIAERLKI